MYMAGTLNVSSLGKKNGVGLGCDTKLIVESVMPDLLHVTPVGNNTVFNRILQSQDTFLGLGFISDVGITLFHTNHDTGLTGTTDQGRKDGARSIISGKTGC
jgi:hypothetical protein